MLRWVGAGGRKPAFAFLSMKKTSVYIDGFNLYYSLKNTSFKWLNLQKLSQFYFNPQQHDIQEIKYFTAKVKSTQKNPSKDIRQDIYLRALKTIPNLQIIYGKFKKRQIRGVLCDFSDRKQLKKDIVEIKKWEEKKSDVNIATHIVSDGYKNLYECAVLISNDTDLTPPLLHIKYELKKLVVIISPYEDIHADLKKSSHFYKTVSPKILKQCQFPENMTDDKGSFFCPPKWKQIRSSS